MNKPNKKGCIPVEDVCMEHEEPLVCKHGCTQALPHKCKEQETIKKIQEAVLGRKLKSFEEVDLYERKLTLEDCMIALSKRYGEWGVYTNLWSSAESGTSAWERGLPSGGSTVDRFTNAKAYGFSVRCLNN